MKFNNTPITPAARIHIERGMVLHENGRKLSKFLECHGKDFLNIFSVLVIQTSNFSLKLINVGME